MSYEGYSQVICENGHYFTRDCFNNYSCYCGGKDAWENMVDQTNGPDQGEIPIEDMQKFIIEPAKTKTCAHCNHTETYEQAKYRVPSKEETNELRAYYNEGFYDDETGYPRIK